MATPDEIEQLRRYVDEPTENTYTDVVLSTRIDGATSLENLASIIWLEKAAAYARLVDMQEGTSRRSLSQLQASAMKMSSQFSGSDTGVGGTTKRTMTRPIERA